MKKFLTASLLISAMAISSPALAHYADWFGKEGQADKPHYMDEALSKLPAEKAADFRSTMKEGHESDKNIRDQIMQLHGDLHAILTAPDFDANAYKAKHAEIQKLYDTMETNRTNAFASAVSELSQDERVTLTRALHNEHGKHGMHHKKKDAAAHMSGANANSSSIQH